MNYTVKILARLSGVTIRTLHYYDEIGLLKPAYVTDSGYRYYQEEQLLLLQQILFFRELGFELKHIQEVLQKNDLDKTKALVSQKQLLQDKIVRLQTLITTIDKTIVHIEGKRMAQDSELFKGFVFDAEQQKKHEKDLEEYLTKKYGNKVQNTVHQSRKKTSGWALEEWDQSSKQLNEICTDLVMMMEKGCTVDALKVQQAIRRHYEWLKHFWTPNKESYAGHADFIVETELKKFYDSYHLQLAQFMSDAIKIFADKSL